MRVPGRRWPQIDLAYVAAVVAVLLLLGSWYRRGEQLTACSSAWQPGNAKPSTAVPPDDERFFGGPLGRIQLDHNGQTLHFEPVPLRKHYEDLFYLLDEDLLEHYKTAGQAERRVAQRVRVVATYEAAAGRDPANNYGGLCNQIYSHIDMLAVLVHMGAEVVLPDGVHRGGNGFNDSFADGAIEPIRAPLDTLFDVDHLLSWAASAGAVLHTEAPRINDTISVVLQGTAISLAHHEPMAFISGIIGSEVIGSMGRWLAAHPHHDPAAPLPVVMLELQPPHLMLALRTDSASELIEEVSRNLRPAPRIREAADAIVTELTADGAAFNGVHLRVEADANFKAYAGSAEGLMDLYTRSMKENGITAPTPLYVASGLLTYMQPDEFQATIAANLSKGGVCGPIHIKEQLLSPEQTEGLLSEALALIDLLVLVRAQRFVGFYISSYSWVVQALLEPQRYLSGVCAGVSLPAGVTNQHKLDGQTSELLAPQLFSGGRSAQRSPSDLSRAMMNHSCCTPAACLPYLAMRVKMRRRQQQQQQQ